MRRAYDVVVFGATGFTGKLVAEYLAQRAPPGLRWAIAGRTESKLAAVKEELARLAPAASGLGVLVADSADASAVARIAQSTQVVCTTVGPYLKYGALLAHACAENGTSYCDLTGEVPFTRRSIDENHARAQETKARVVHSSGFDSVPSDLAALLLHRAFQQHGKAIASASAFVGPVKGAFSGGTVATVMELLAAAGHDPEQRSLQGDPYALLPDRSRDRGPDRGDQMGVRFDPLLKEWTAPWLMAGINTRVVRRSNALQDFAYGKGFSYREVMSMGRGPAGFTRSAGLTMGLGAFVGLASFGAGRAVLSPLLPKPGEGPSKADRDAGFFRMRVIGEGDGLRIDALVEGKGDPGYAGTAVMLGESALCLALDAEKLPARYGVLTPASAMGMALVERLRAAGLTFETRVA